MSTKTKETGTVNTKQITESVKAIEVLTYRYKRKRMTTEDYIKLMHENLSKLTSDRDYWEYLKSIGQEK